VLVEGADMEYNLHPKFPVRGIIWERGMKEPEVILGWEDSRMPMSLVEDNLISDYLIQYNRVTNAGELVHDSQLSQYTGDIILPDDIPIPVSAGALRMFGSENSGYYNDPSSDEEDNEDANDEDYFGEGSEGSEPGDGHETAED